MLPFIDSKTDAEDYPFHPVTAWTPAQRGVSPPRWMSLASSRSQTWTSKQENSRNPEKKTTSIALNNILSQLGNVMAPYFFVQSDEPRYLMAFILMFVCSWCCVAGSMLLKWCLWRENKKLLKYALEHGTPYNPYLQ